MMEIQKIAESTTLADSESVKIALKRMKKVPTHELHYYLVARDTLQTTSPATRQAITLAQVESERRSANQTLSLAIITTIISGAVGLLGVLLGAYLSN
ncbi:MAG: hypothetical protein IPH79_06715 [Sphingomonadales bacterium]|nr:hypothetical protein [Sphingomonadales bacterium]